jgi:hypothetical protein
MCMQCLLMPEPKAITYLACVVQTSGGSPSSYGGILTRSINPDKSKPDVVRARLTNEAGEELRFEGFWDTNFRGREVSGTEFEDRDLIRYWDRNSRDRVFLAEDSASMAGLVPSTLKYDVINIKPNGYGLYGKLNWSVIDEHGSRRNSGDCHGSLSLRLLSQEF